MIFDVYFTGEAVGHLRLELTMPPTAAMSPSLNFLTALPAFTARPTISWPGTQGSLVGTKAFHLLRTVCKSEWHMSGNAGKDFALAQLNQPTIIEFILYSVL